MTRANGAPLGGKASLGVTACAWRRRGTPLHTPVTLRAASAFGVQRATKFSVIVGAAPGDRNAPCRVPGAG